MAESGQDKGRDDEIKKIFSDFSKQKNLEIEQEQKNKKNSTRFVKARGVITCLGIILSVILLFNLWGKIFNENSPLRSPRPWAVGKRVGSDYKIDGCIFRLWRIRKAIDIYYADYKKFPENMQQLYETDCLRQKTLCPASSKEYVFEKRKTVKVFSCPEPAAHQVDITAIYCNVVSSPPIIERINDEKGPGR